MVLSAFATKYLSGSGDYGPSVRPDRPVYDEHAAKPRPRPRRPIAGILFVLMGLALLSVNVFPSINNDGVDYIGHSQSLIDSGFVRLGYRQIGYPLALAMERFVSQFVGIEALVFSVLVQRALLVFAVVYSVWLWRWRSAPLVVLAVTPSFLAYTNLVMTESLTISLALLLAGVVFHHFESVRGIGPIRLFGRPIVDSSVTKVTAWGVATLAFSMLAIRFPFAVFGVVPAAIWFAARRRGDRSPVPMLAFLAYLVAGGLFTAGLALENADEYGTATPISRTERSAYWAAWHVSFTLHPENRTDPALADYYDGGSPYIHIWELEAENPEYLDQASLYKESTEALLQAAGLDRTQESFYAFLGALTGGRLNDVGPRLEQVLDTDAGSVDDAIHVNDVSKQRGWDVFNDRYNEGHKPQSMITSPVFPSPPLPDVADLLRILLPFSIITTWVIAVWKRRVMLAAVYSIPVLVYSVAIALVLADNVRFLMPTSVYAIAGLSALWSASDRGVRDSRRQT